MTELEGHTRDQGWLTWRDESAMQWDVEAIKDLNARLEYWTSLMNAGDRRRACLPTDVAIAASIQSFLEEALVADLIETCAVVQEATLSHVR